MLTGLAFATPIEAWAVTRTKDTSLAVVYRFGVIPLFLFSGTFFPVTQLPGVAPAGGLPDPAVARGGAVPGALPGHRHAARRGRWHVGYLAACWPPGSGRGNRTYRRRLYV